jgi:hypothetical protein
MGTSQKGNILTKDPPEINRLQEIEQHQTMVDSGLTPDQNRLPSGIMHIQHPQSQSDGPGCVTALANKEPGQNMDIITWMDCDTRSEHRQLH